VGGIGIEGLGDKGRVFYRRCFVRKRSGRGSRVGGVFFREGARAEGKGWKVGGEGDGGGGGVFF